MTLDIPRLLGASDLYALYKVDLSGDLQMALNSRPC